MAPDAVTYAAVGVPDEGGAEFEIAPAAEGGAGGGATSAARMYWDLAHRNFKQVCGVRGARLRARGGASASDLRASFLVVPPRVAAAAPRARLGAAPRARRAAHGRLASRCGSPRALRRRLPPPGRTAAHALTTLRAFSSQPQPPRAPGGADDPAFVARFGTSKAAAMLAAVAATPLQSGEDALHAFACAQIHADAAQQFPPEHFYTFDLGLVMERWRVWTTALPRVKPYYAVKCNPDPAMLALLASLGTGFDCASPFEIELVTGAPRPPRLR